MHCLFFICCKLNYSQLLVFDIACKIYCYFQLLASRISVSQRCIAVWDSNMIWGNILIAQAASLTCMLSKRKSFNYVILRDNDIGVAFTLLSWQHNYRRPNVSKVDAISVFQLSIKKTRRIHANKTLRIVTKIECLLWFLKQQPFTQIYLRLSPCFQKAIAPVKKTKCIQYLCIKWHQENVKSLQIVTKVSPRWSSTIYTNKVLSCQQNTC